MNVKNSHTEIQQTRTHPHKVYNSQIINVRGFVAFSYTLLIIVDKIRPVSFNLVYTANKAKYLCTSEVQQ